MEVAIIGSGYVGLVAGACFADAGNDVICVDIDEKKIEKLKKGESPIYEPGLEDFLRRNIKEKRLSFTTSIKDGVERSKVIFIAVGTPQDEDGSADLTHVLDVATEIGRYINGYKVVVDKSTVPVGTAKAVKAKIAEMTDHEFDVVSNPEFLKEGAALDDFLKPDRVVIGVSSEKAEKIMRELYAPFVRTNNPILVMDVPSAEMTKYTANAMLATRISFMNEISNLCEKVGANVDSVRVGIGTDSRIGMSFLFPGIGYGGSCFPKDVQALIKTAKDHACDLRIARAVEETNATQKRLIVDKIVKHYGSENLSGKKFAVWGLAFKPRTDDVREAPALTVCRLLIGLGAHLSVFDPEAMQTFRTRFGDHEMLTYAETNYDTLKDADALIICTEWSAFRAPAFDRMKALMKAPLIFDGRNVFSLESMRGQGFTYYSLGREVIRA
ncbi:MAG: UDP-glucose dehydrogenase family protein [Bdellovibrionota bacterium]|jgi:UDPglucose 6-dehydrogenase